MNKILAKIFFCPEDAVDNVLIHIPVGAVNVGIAMISGWLALLFGAGFVVYELNSSHYIPDKPYQDIKGWLWGIGIVAIIWRMVA